MLPQPDPVADAARSRLLARIAAGLFATSTAAIALLWVLHVPAGGATPIAPPADPLEGRRATVPSEAPLERGSPRPSGERLHFADPQAAGVSAYRAGEIDQALAAFQEAAARNPNDPEALSNLGQMLVRRNAPADALPYFEKACALNPDRWAYRFNLARALALLERWEEAVAAYRHAQGLFPDDYVTTFNLGLTLHKAGNDAAAVEEYRKAIALAPLEASFRLALGISCERLGDLTAAAEAYREYLQLAPSAPDAEQVRLKVATLAPRGT